MDELVVRHVAPVALELLQVFPGIVIEGARQVGKSTLARQLMPDAEVVNLDEASSRAAARIDPALFLNRPGPLILDEVQHVPELTLAVKASIDADRRPGRFLLTGSSSLLRARGLADSLAGRVGRLSLYGFSQGEQARRPDDFVVAVLAGSGDDHPIAGFATPVTRRDYAARLEAGSYPQPSALAGRSRRQWFDSYLAGLIYRDLGELRGQYDPARGLAIIRLLAGNPARELVTARVARDTGIPPSSATIYLDLWRSVGLLGSLPPWTPNLSKRESGRAKAFLLDSGLALRLSRVSSEQLLVPENLESFGGYLEAMVAAELMRQQTWSQADFDLYHFRDRDGWEVDVIIELTGGGVIGLEVKASTTFRGDQFNALRRLRDRLGPRFIAGLVLNTGQAGYRYADRLYGLPIAALWELDPSAPRSISGNV